MSDPSHHPVPPIPVVSEVAPRWQIDRRVPITLLGAIIAQIIGVVWFAATMVSTISDMQVRIAALEHQAQQAQVQTETRWNEAVDRLARIESTLNYIAGKDLLPNHIILVPPPPEKAR